MDLPIAKRPCDSVTNKDWEMNAFLPENKRHFLPQDTLATKNHSSHFAPNLTLLLFKFAHAQTLFSAVYRVSIVTHNELRTSAPKSFDEVWVQDNTASSSWPGLSNEMKNVCLTVTTFDFLGFKNSRGLHLSEERYLEGFSCLKFIIRFFILLGITVM